MGSSKKHKDKDREHKKKRKHRSRSRERSRERDGKRRHRERDEYDDQDYPEPGRFDREEGEIEDLYNRPEAVGMINHIEFCLLFLSFPQGFESWSCKTETSLEIK